jgi:hypothetical protein
MSNSNGDPTRWLRELTERFGHIKFPSGVIGKSTYLTIALLILWAIIAVKLPTNSEGWFSPLLAVGLIATAVVVWLVRSNQRFAERNPGQAMLDGAEFLDYYKFEVQAKGVAHVPASPLTTDIGKPSPPQIIDDRADQ